MLLILVPYFKIEFFQETLKSLEAQTCKDFKLYISNDASSENPEELINSTLKTAPFSYKKYSNNLGGKNLVKQWERMINDAKLSGWFMILGDDDVLSENFVEEFYKNLPEIKENKCNVIKFSQQWIDEDGAPINDFTSYQKLLKPGENLNFKLAKGHRSSLSEYIFNTDSYHKFGFVDLPLAWGTDDLAILEFSNGKPIYFIEEAKVFVRISPKNISGREDNNELKRAAGRTYEKYILQKHFSKLEKTYILAKADSHIKYYYLDNEKLGFSLLKIYWHFRKFKKILALPKTYYHMYKHSQKTQV